MKRIMINKDACTGCMNCTVACMCEHSTISKSIYKLNLSDKHNEACSRITLDSKNKPTPIFCRHCDEPKCVETCMSGAMTKDDETGYVTYNKDKCAYCYMCVMSCPFGVLKPDEVTKKHIVKCDMCPDRKTPACIESCPVGAIYLEEV
ncbi:carbon-monoxide dehydrogenase iron sulfur subunit [Clostridium cavendishii DSM 21758]|uniref:Carbon-monoxide dehydrogenase iron sulfur subunit n=1 Tax=Clostridium cavendishii DSM 21758 TaxID=1121302 RepID=A0A1M6UH03_9CLOT|nr:4Fe-4S dicluster domain-containing protein [Clostridium cavendishii]SHK68456.1 carbon-monoxide dehydrogenase iron sulfur subunit [Clostridium cavendishii DSM 21758]